MRHSFWTLILAVSMFGCQEENKVTEENQDKPEQNQPPKAAEPDKSDLSSFMVEMERHLQAVKDGLADTASLRQRINMQALAHLEASPHVEKDSAFMEFTSEFLGAYDSLMSADNMNLQQRYDMVISSCISCHEVKCPGPIPRIQKLER